MEAPSRNAACPCGSGKKYKRCCGAGLNPDTRKDIQPALTYERAIREALNMRQRGDASKAIQLIEHALGLRPKEAMLHGLLGTLFLELGKAEEARKSIQAGLAIDPRNPHLHNYHGQILGKCGDIHGAEQAFSAAVALDPKLIEAWFNLGITQLEYSRPSEAINSFQQALALAPDHGATLLLLAKTYYYLRELGNAEAMLRRAEKLGVQPARTALWLALVLAAQGRNEESREQEQRAMKQAPGDISLIHKELAEAELHVGRLDAAESWLRKAISHSPEVPALYCQLAKTRKFSENDRPFMEKMASFLPRASLPEKRELYFSLGKIHTDSGDYDTSFKYYKAGNDLVRSLVPSDPSIYAREADRIISRFSLDKLSGLAHGSLSDTPIFIVGAPRSGTTLAEMIIGSHSRVSGAGELIYWARAGKPLISEFPKNYSAALARDIAEKYLEVLARHANLSRHVIDKMPENFWYLGLIHAVFPNARIIHCTRHPIDTCLSIYFQNLSDSHAYKWDLDSLALWYRQYQRLMAHWRGVIPPSHLHDLNYEQLVDAPEDESRKLMNFLGLDWEEGMLDYYKQDRAVFTASKWQVRQQVYSSSKARWRRYENHLGPLLGLMEHTSQD